MRKRWKVSYRSSFSSDQQSETKELQTLIALAKQAGYQYPDVKLDKLREVLEDLFAEDPQRKVIIFTEFTADRIISRISFFAGAGIQDIPAQRQPEHGREE